MDAGLNNNCLFYTSGRVFCWGLRSDLLYYTSTSLLHYWTPRLVTDGLGRALDTAVELVVTQDRACVRGRDSTVQCFGGNSSVGVVSGLVDVVDIDARTAGNFFAVTRDGRVFTWNGVPRPATNPATQVPGITDAVEVAGGSGFGCVRRSGGAVSCWGANTNGQLGNASTTASTTPVAVMGLTDAVALAGGFNHMCAVRGAARTVSCWGANTVGQLGDGTMTQRTTPVTVTGLSGVQQMRCGTAHCCAVLADGSVRCWGGNESAQIGNGMMVPAQLTAIAVPGLPPSRHVTVYEHHSCAIGRDDMVRCWGRNYWGEAGGGTEARTTPVAVRGITNATDVQSAIVAGILNEPVYHKAALISDGRVLTWGSGPGSNNNGQLGDGTVVSRTTPAAVVGLTDAAQFSTSGIHTCVARRTGAVVCWGRNDFGQVGDGTVVQRNTPVAVPGLNNVVEVRVGILHSCARHMNGTVSCWGRNFHGELGDGTMTNRETPRLVPGINSATSLQLGDNHSCVRLADATVRCWGRNIEGQLADGSNTNRFVPTQPTYAPAGMPAVAAPLTMVSDLRCGGNVCYARVTGDIARLWGGGNLRVVNDGNRVITVPQWVSFAFGATCQYRTDNMVYCTGNNEFGQVGIGRQSTSEPYTLVPGMFSRLQTGNGSPCAIERGTGRVLCWGPTRYEYLTNAGTPPVDAYTRMPAVITLP
jgi:alpha-tubulin suppressor-like RCC1 family protein